MIVRFVYTCRIGPANERTIIDDRAIVCCIRVTMVDRQVP
jgi:hypothetical protein